MKSDITYWLSESLSPGTPIGRNLSSLLVVPTPYLADQLGAENRSLPCVFGNQKQQTRQAPSQGTSLQPILEPAFPRPYLITAAPCAFRFRSLGVVELRSVSSAFNLVFDHCHLVHTAHNRRLHVKGTSTPRSIIEKSAMKTRPVVAT